MSYLLNIHVKKIVNFSPFFLEVLHKAVKTENMQPNLKSYFNSHSSLPRKLYIY